MKVSDYRLLNFLSEAPMTIDDIEQKFGQAGLDALENLIAQGKVKKTVHIMAFSEESGTARVGYVRAVKDQTLREFVSQEEPDEFD